MKHAKSRGLLLRRTHPELRRTHIDKLLQEIPKSWGVRFARQENTFNFPNGSVLELGACQYESDAYSYAGTEYDDIAIDEATQFCLHPNTEVLTEHGWQKISTLKSGIKTATLSPSYQIEYHPISEVHDFPSRSGLFELYQRKGIAFSVTPNHRMVIEKQKGGEWSFCRADSLSSFSWHVRSGVWEGVEHDSYDFSPVSGRGIGENQNSIQSIPVDDWLEFLGWYLSEGCAFTRTNGSSGRISIRQTKDQPSLRSLFERLPWRWSYRTEGSYLIYSRQLYEELKPMGDTYQKRIPRWIFGLSRRQLKIFWDAFMAGDGYRTRSGGWSIGLANEGLRDDLQIIAIHLGYVATAGYALANGKYPVYRLSVSRRSRLSVEVRRSDIRHVPYRGSVWCIVVEPHHAFFARYKGRVFVTGNTRFQFDILRSCIRTINPKVKTQMFLGANPGGVGHMWVKGEFIDQAKEDHRFVPAKVYDNPVIMQANPEYVKILEDLPEQQRKAFLDGDWNIFEGQAFPEWGMGERYIVDSFDYPIDQCRRVVGFDWGYNDPGCAVWVAFAPTGHAFVYRELYQSKKDPEEWARELARILEHESVQGFVLPHDCYSKQGGWDSVAETFQRFNIRPLVRGNTLSRGMRHQRKAILHRYLANHADESPYLLFSKEIRNGARTIPSLIYSETDLEDLDSSGEDHFYDALTLALVSFGQQDPSGSTGISIRHQGVPLNPTWSINEDGDPLFPSIAQFVDASVRRAIRNRRDIQNK
ncbi:MAG: hypothetical protein QME66_04215 [Candidatus Eisenbacteria bacterium]|nr:hypothetical protein [Candidatus Eisenbacteria bacterium]